MKFISVTMIDGTLTKISAIHINFYFAREDEGTMINFNLWDHLNNTPACLAVLESPEVIDGLLKD